jgi:hypothetical protein
MKSAVKKQKNAMTQHHANVALIKKLPMASTKEHNMTRNSGGRKKRRANRNWFQSRLASPLKRRRNP